MILQPFFGIISGYRKREVGKTYLIRQCLEESEYPFVELNFIEQPELVELFAGAKDAKDLLMRLSLTTSQNLIPGQTIIFFASNPGG